MNFNTPTTDTYEYRDSLFKYDIPIIEEEYYLNIELGTITHHQGWILYIPINHPETHLALSEIIPKLLDMKLNFKIVKNRTIHIKMNNGIYGPTMIGRNIIIKLDILLQLDFIVPTLDTVSARYLGPTLGYDYKIGSNLYARYGSYITRTTEDGVGNLDRIIMDSNGKWFRDKYRKPVSLPRGVQNPFEGFIKKTPQDNLHTTLLGKYKIDKSVNADIWGTIYEGSAADNNQLETKYYILRGKRKTLIDDFNRDTYDRLEWAAEVTSKLDENIPAPKVIDFWKEDNYAFLILSRSSGKNLKEISIELLNNTIWNKVPLESKNIIIKILIKIANALSYINSVGYVNRLINWNNISISPSHDITIINWALSYNFTNNTPSPPFQTKEALHSELKTISIEKNDICSYGHLLISVLSGCHSKTLIEDEVEESWKEKIAYITGDHSLTEIISRCLSTQKINRPTWNEVVEALQIHGESTNQMNSNITRTGPHAKEALTSIIQSAIDTLPSTKFTINSLWFSSIEHPYDTDVYPYLNKHFYTAIYRGVGGVLYLLAKALSMNFDLSLSSDNIENSMRLIIEKKYHRSRKFIPGLHYGSSGIAVTICEMINSGLLNINDEYTQIIQSCLSKDNVLYDVINGVAGDGLALMICQNYICTEFYEEKLTNIALQLLRTQQPSGAWQSPGRSSSDIINGFGYGVAGICYFLLEYAQRLNSADALRSAISGISYLNTKKIESSQTCWWPSSSFDLRQESEWCFGSAGFILTYLKAYEYTQNLDYYKTAEKALNSIQPHRISPNLSQSHGLAGIGETYLEAFRITQSEQWLDRATLIVDTLCKLRHSSADIGTYWNTDILRNATADFMLGQSGILHFLIRYHHSDKISYPLLPSPISQPKLLQQ